MRLIHNIFYIFIIPILGFRISKFTTSLLKLEFTRRLLILQFLNNPIIILLLKFSYNIQPTQFHIFTP